MKVQWHHRNIKDHKRLLLIAIFQLNGQPRRNWQIPRNGKSSKTKPGRSKRYKGTNYQYWYWINYLKKLNSQQTKVCDKMVSLMNCGKYLMITLYAKQKKRHRCIAQSFGLCGRRREWDVSREQHWNMYII